MNRKEFERRRDRITNYHMSSCLGTVLLALAGAVAVPHFLLEKPGKPPVKPQSVEIYEEAANASPKILEALGHMESFDLPGREQIESGYLTLGDHKRELSSTEEFQNYQRELGAYEAAMESYQSKNVWTSSGTGIGIIVAGFGASFALRGMASRRLRTKFHEGGSS